MFRLVNPPFGQGIEKCVTLPFERNKKRSFMAFMAFMALGLLPSGKTTLDLTGSPRNSVRLLLFSKHFYRLATMWTVTPPRQKSTNQPKNDLTYKNTCSDEVPQPHSMFQFLTIHNPLPSPAEGSSGSAEPAIRDGFTGGWMVVFKWVLIGFNRFQWV